MALRTYIRISDGAKVTLNDEYLTESTKLLLKAPEPIEVPAAIKTKKKKNESN